MKYPIDKELKSLSKYSGAMVVRLYPIINIGYRLNKCRSDQDVSVRKVYTPGYNNSKIATLIFEPKHCISVQPCIVLFHGGGFLLSAAGAHYQLAKWYVQKLNCKVIMPDYRLLPRYRYPVAIEDGYNSYLWAVQNSDRLGIDKGKIIVTGDSAGGNIAGAVTVMLKDRKQNLPKGVMMIYPVLDKRMVTESMKKYTDTPIWDSRCNKLFWEMYLKDQDVSQTRYASISEINSLDFFPDTYIEVAEFDCLKDEGIRFAEKLISENVSAEYHVVKGACHGFEAAMTSSILGVCIKRRIEWIEDLLR